MLEEKIDEKEVRIYSIHSIKGGVGKSTLALMLGHFYAYQGKKTVIIDADLSGSSLADTDLFGLYDDGKYLSPKESLNRLKNDQGDLKPYFLNHFLLCPPGQFLEYTFERPLWRASGKEKLEKFLSLIPSSPLSPDVNKVIPYLYEEDRTCFFRFRFENLIQQMFYKENFDIIIFDTSPGIWGLSRSLINLMVDLGKDENRKKYNVTRTICLVTTEDPFDHRSLFRLMDEFLYQEGIRIEPKVVFTDFS